jgi:hypothetical protein
MLIKTPRNFGGTTVTDLTYISRASHDVHLINTNASSLDSPLEQMNEGEESLPSTETRKKRRGSGFRYSSRKHLKRSRAKRETAKAELLELASVTKRLSYSRGLSSGNVTGSGGSHCLDKVVEHDDENLELSKGTASIDEDCLLNVRTSLSGLSIAFFQFHCWLFPF